MASLSFNIANIARRDEKTLHCRERLQQSVMRVQAGSRLSASRAPASMAGANRAR